MGGRFASQMGAPLTAQPIEIEDLEVGNDRQRGSIERQRSRPALPPPGASPPARTWFARGSCRLRCLRRLLLEPAAVHRLGL
jgi:hypothetical protein